MKNKIQKLSILSLLVFQAMLPACSAGAKSQKENNTLLKVSPQIVAKASLSQSKILQGSDGLVYLQVELEAPAKANNALNTSRRPTDFVVILDRSGSMAAAKKMEYAQQALKTLVQQLSDQDRFGLVTFDDSAEITHSLDYVNRHNKAFIQQKIAGINPRGNTNISGGISAAIQMIQSSAAPYRSERIILISDGLANRGITDPQALAALVSQSNASEGLHSSSGTFALSSIGVGLDFNEYLLSNLADRGQGSYYYLQNPSTMYNILAQEFRGASEIYASNLQIQLDLPPDISLIDASGYPLQRQGNRYTVLPGHLYQKQKKILYFTLALPSVYTYPSRPLGNVDLSFNVQGNFYQVPLIHSDLYVACLPASQSYEAKESINSKVYEEAWTKNNYGRALQDSARKISEGDQQGAAQVMQKYRAKASEANAVAPSGAIQSRMNEAAKTTQDMEKAFSSPSPEASKSLGKDFHYKGIQDQR